MAPLDRRRFLSLSLRSALGAALLGCGPTGRRQVAPVAPVGQGGRAAPAPAAAPAASRAPTARAVILLYAGGGPSQIDTFDPKPGSPGAGGVGAIDTEVPGLALSQLLPQLARRAGHLAVVRSIVGTEGSHARASHLMHTGYVPAGGVEHPDFGALVSSERGGGELPAYVSIGPGAGAGAGFLGAAHAPLRVGNPARGLANLSSPAFVDEERHARRVALWRSLEDGFAAGRQSATVRDQRAVAERALALMDATGSVAFDLDREPAATRAVYGESRLGLGCLMARRLVEAGVPFVEVVQPGWDTHADNLARVTALAADLDRAMSALLDDLAARGLLDSTMIVWTGDFGRTPELDDKGGRGHYPQVTPAVFAGGGTRGGQVIGATDERGIAVVAGEVPPQAVFATLARATGLDPHQVRHSRAGRPIKTVDDADPIPGLLA